MPNWTIFLVPPLLLLAIALNQGWFDRRRQDDGASRMLMWLSSLRGVSPQAADQIQLTVCGALLDRLQPMPGAAYDWPQVSGAAWDWSQRPNDGPLPEAMQDIDPRYPHLAAGQYGDWTTGTFAAITLGGQE